MIIIDKEESLHEDGEVWLRGRLLGKGGFASVNLARFPSSLPLRYQQIPPIVAVKSTSTNLESLVHEKSIYDSLGNSPFLIRCFGDDATASYFGHLNYNLFLEYASGGSLRDLIQSSNGFGLAESYVRDLTRSILRGIYHIHEAGFVHCDIKPHNVFLVKEGELGLGLGFVAKIGDFGLTKRDDVVGIGVRGTVGYLGPECFEKRIQRKESDIWAFGCVVFSMLTGTLRWEVCPNIVELLSDRISFEAMDFVIKCLKVDPTERPTASMLMNHPFYTKDYDELVEYCYSESKAEDDDDLCDGFKRQEDFVNKLLQEQEEDICADFNKLGLIS